MQSAGSQASEAVSDRTDAINVTAGWVFGLVVLGVAVLGMGQCIQYERWKERTCMQQGGAIISRVSPGATENRDACMKIDVQMTPLVMPKP